MDFTTNDEIGVLIEGHEYPPIILCPWHHPYYQRMFEQDVGMAKAMDLYMWSLDVDRSRQGPPGDLGDGGQGCESEHGIVCRSFRKKDLQQEVTRFLEVYNSAWETQLGLRAAERRGGRATTPRTSSRCSTRTGRWSPKRRTRARSWAPR